MLVLRPAPRLDGVGAVELARELPELVLRRLELAQRDIEQAVGVDRDALVERQLALELLLAKAERRSGLWRHLFFEILDVARDGVRGLGRGIGEVAEQVHVVEGRKRARQILFDEVQRTAERFEADLQEDTR